MKDIQPLGKVKSKTSSRGSDQTARMRRLVLDFAGRTCHVVGNLKNERYTTAGNSTSIKKTPSIDSDQTARMRRLV